MKGTYIIEKYSTELIGDERVKKDLLDTIVVENDITFEWALKVFQNSVGEANANEIVVCASELRQYKPMSGYIDTARGWVRPPGGPDIAAQYFPAAGMNDSYWEFKSTINAPLSVTRYIRAVCLSTTDSNDTQECYSIAALASPCPQTTSEILQITYRMTLDTAAVTANSDASAQATENRFRLGILGGGTSPYMPDAEVYANTWDTQLWGTGIIERVNCMPTDDDEMIWTRTDNSLRQTRQLYTNARFGSGNASTNPTEHCGHPVKSMALGEGAQYHIGDVNKGSVSSVQNTYGRSAPAGESRPPFLDADYIASSAAVVSIVDQGNWVNMIDDSYNMPWLYRITVEAGGNVGVSTYKIKRRRLGWPYANTVNWEQNGIVIPTFDYRVPSLTPTIATSDDNTNERHGQVLWASLSDTNSQRDNWLNRTNGDAGTLVQRYMYPEMLCFDYTGITVHASTGEYVNFDTNSTPALNVTEVLQCATDGSTIYVADAATGCFMIQRDFRDYTDSNATITQISPPGITDATSCRGVTTGYEFQEGIVTNVRVNFGGSNYAVGDTVSIAGANGAAATAEVASVDADGAILTIKVTNGGSGYIYDHISAYVSSGVGVGANLDVEVGTDKEVWALFDDATDGFMYLAHGTKVTANSVTNWNFDTTADTITRTGGSFITDGFRVGQKLFIEHAEDAGNNGVFTIASVDSATQITVSENLVTNSTDTAAQVTAQAWEIMTETITGDQTSVQFSDNGASADTIDNRVGGTSFVTQGFREGMKIVVSSANTGANNGVYTIAAVTTDTITLDIGDSLTDDAVADSNAVISTLTDFTITNYTSGAPGRTGFIGLHWDREHADDRFLMITPASKVPNDGVAANSGATSFDWWSFANSTGTTTAGLTDGQRTTSYNESASQSGEQIATLCAAPLNNSDLWVVQSYVSEQANSYTWGVAARAAVNTFGYISTGRLANNVFKTQTMDSAVVGFSTTAANQVVVRKDGTELNSATTWDSLIGSYLLERGGTHSAGYETNGVVATCLGRGMMLGGLGSDPRGRFVYTLNADGKIESEALMPYGFWQEYGWDGTRWVLDNVSPKTTHAQVSFTGTTVSINHTTGVIVGGGTWAAASWAGDGFEVGDTITITTAEDTGNDGSYFVESVSGTTLTITPYSNTLTATNADDTTAAIVGDHAIIDGLALSFDTTGGALVVNEYYDTHLADSILCDNATNASWDILFYESGGEVGSTFTPSAVPSSDEGFVTEKFTVGNGATENVYWRYEKPGRVCGGTQTTNTNIHYGQQQLGTTDWEMRWRQTASTAANECRVGIVPWANIIGGAELLYNVMDWCLSVQYDPVNNPQCDVYTATVHSTGNIGTVTSTIVTDRIVTDITDTHLDFTGDAGEGTVISPGDGGGGGAYVVGDVITMDDGTTITVDAIDGNADITEFSITTSSTSTSERTERIIGANNYTDLTFAATGSTITQNGGTDFITDGFLIGMKIIVDGTTSNDGYYTISDIATGVITVAEALVNETVNPTYFGTGLYQTSVTPSAGRPTNFAITLGTNNEVAADLGNDTFFMKRVGSSTGNIRFGINGIERYRITSAYTLDVGPGATFSDSVPGTTINDWEMDFTKAKRAVKIGNGSTTGAANPNFREIPIQAITLGTSDFSIQLDGVDVTTIYTDGVTSPAAGEVSVLCGAGELWFNAADATKTITGNWKTIFGINLV